jgi:PAS domain S-box-containing protein
MRVSVYPVPEGIAAHWHDITERKLVEVALTESEERARLTAEAGQTGLFEWEPTTGRMYWSDQNFRTLGLSPGEVEPSYTAWASRVHPDDLPRVEALVAASQSQRRPYYGVHRVVWPDGSIHVMEARAQFAFDDSGTCTRMRGTYVDVTERALAEQALRESEARFRAMADDAPLPIWMTDALGAVQFINATYRDFFGVLDADADGIDWPSLIHPDDRAAYVAAFAESIRTCASFEAEARARRSDGSWRWISSRGVPRWTADGGFLGLVGTSPDVTERRRLEEHERAASVQAHFRSLFESVPGPYVVLTPDDFRIVAVSDAYLQATYTTRDTLIGRSLFHVFAAEEGGPSADALASLRASLSRVVEHGRIDVIPIHRLAVSRPDSLGGGKEERWWSPVSAPVIGPDDRVAFVIHRAEDVTSYMTERSDRMSEKNDHRHAAEVVMRTHELHRVNEQLRAEIEERRRLEEQRGQLMRQLVVAQEAERRRVARELHDGLGQHLTALNFSLESLMSDVSGSPALRTGLDQMQRLARTLDSEVDRIAADLRPAVLDDLGLEDALHRHVRLWSEEVGVPADIHTRGLERRLEQVIETAVYRVVQEALTNVHKHARATRISVVVERRDGELVVAIEDNGVGFAAPAAAGTSSLGGLGLSTMRERAALVGGNLQVESDPSVGTTVYLRIAIDG